MIINEMAMELTRRCNMRCAHCLRGPAQRIDMNVEKLRHNIFHNITKVEELVLTGGEPTLAVKQLRDLHSYLQWHAGSIDIGNVFAAINGKRFSRSFLEIMNEIYGLCTEKDVSSIRVSNDEYHAAFPQKLDRYRDVIGEGIYSIPIWVESARKYKVVPQGRANKLSGVEYNRNLRLYSKFVYNKDTDSIVSDDWGKYVTVTIAASGNVCTSCNLDYKTQDATALGNVNDETLESILLRNSVHVTDAECDMWSSKMRPVYETLVPYVAL